MKKQIIILITLVILCLTSINTAQVEIGIIGGWNISNLDVKDNDLSSEWNYGAGAVVDIYFSNNIGLRTEPMYLVKGGVMEADQSDPRLDISLDFIELPVLFLYEFGEYEKFYLLGGFSIGYQLSSKIESDIGGIPFSADLSSAINSIDVSGVLGVGLKLPIESVSLFFEAKSSYGLTNMQKGGTIYFKSGHIEIPMELDSEADAFSTLGVQIMGGITIPL